VSQHGQYVIEMRSNRIRGYLSLYHNGELIASGRDSSGNARIETELAPGEYIVEASSYLERRGRYRIVARRL